MLCLSAALRTYACLGSSVLGQLSAWTILLGVVIFALTLGIGARAALQARRGTYYFMRENALKRARYWFLAGTVALILAVVSALIISNQPAPSAVATPNTPTRIVVFAPTSAPSPSPTPTFTRTPTPSPTPTISKTIAPTLKPGSVPNLLLTPLPSAVPVAPAAKFTFSTLASVLDSKQQPVDVGVVFPQGTHTIHIFFRASGVNNNARWAVFCKKGNQVVDSFIALWIWGQQAQGAHAVCSIDGSLGVYSVVTYLDFNEQFETVFKVIVPPPTATSTPAPTNTP